MSKDAKHYEPSIEKLLDIPFKDFMPGQIIQSSQFNDDMLDIEDKVNEIITKHNGVDVRLSEHQRNLLNPHCVTATQINAYEIEEVDELINDVKNGNLNDEAITNRVLTDACVDNRVLQDGAVTLSKLDTNIGNQIDISNNMSIKERYTKLETDAIIQEKVGDGTYSKEQIDAKFEEYQAGTIVDGTIDVTKLKNDVGRKLDITHNPSISNRYTKSEVNSLIAKNGLPKDWGNLSDEVDDEIVTQSGLGVLPISDVMVCGEFKATETDVLNVKIQDIEFAKGEFNTLEERLDNVDTQLSHNIEQINDLKLYNDENSVVNIYVSPNGDDSSSGDNSENPTSLKNAFKIIQDLSDKIGVLKGNYTINLSEGVYKGKSIGNSLTNINSLKRINIKGASVKLGERPKTVLDGEILDLKYTHGMAFYNCYLYVENIIFINFMETQQIQSTQTRCGIAFTNCNASIVNVWGDGCSWAGVLSSGGRLYTSSGKMNNCRIGISCQFNTQVSIGNDDKNLSDNERATITNCLDAGIRLSDGVVGHIDYINLDKNTYSIVMAHHSDANLVNNKITNSNIGLVLENASSWYNSNNIFENNDINISSRDNSSETTLKSSTINNCHYNTTSKGVASVSAGVFDSFNLELFNLIGKKCINIYQEGEISIIDNNSNVNLYTKIDGIKMCDNIINTITGGYKFFKNEILIIPLSKEQVRCINKFYLNGVLINYVNKTIDITSANISFCYEVNGITGQAGWRSYKRKIDLVG